jgi:hypothetical protein
VAMAIILLAAAWLLWAWMMGGFASQHLTGVSLTVPSVKGSSSP